MPLVTVRTPEGGTTQVDEADLPAFLQSGFEVETEGEAAQRTAQAAEERQFGGTAGAIEAGIYGGARGASLGLSDVILRAGGADPEALRGLRENQRNISIASEIFGGVAPALVTGGAATPAGALSRGALGITERVAAGGGAARYAAGAALGGATEGAVQGVGQYVSDVALENKDLSAEGFLASAGQGALWGGAAGGALAGVERGTIAARRLFPRHIAKDREAVELLEQDWLAKTDDAIKQGDELEKVARSTLDDLRIRSLELNLEREKIRQATDLSPASKIRLKEIDVERAKVSAARKALRAQQNAERATQGLPDVPPEVQASVVPTGPPAQDAAAGVVPSLAGADDLETRLAATKGLLDQGVAFEDIGAAAQGRIDDLAIASQNSAHEAGMLADDAVRGEQQSAERLASLTEDHAARKQAVKDWIAKYKPGAKSEYSSTFGGGKKGGGAGPVRTDRTRLLPEEEVEASINDRVFAGIGSSRDVAASSSAAPTGAGAKVPDGFDVTSPADGAKLFKTDAPSVRQGVPSHADAADFRDTVHVVRPSELAERPLFGTGTTEQRVRSVDDAWGEGKKLPVIEVDITPSGRYSVQDGNHRLQAAAATDRPIAVRFRPVQEEFAADYADDIGERVRGALPKARPRGAELDSAYDDAIERAATAPNRAAQERALREAADLEDQIFETVAARGGQDKLEVERILAKRAEMAQDSYSVALRRAEKRAMAEELPPQSQKAAAERADLEAYDRGLRQQQFAGGKTAGQVAEEILGAARAETPTPAVPSGLGRFIDDADEAIRVVGEYERAQHALAQELGTAAPPASAQHAAQYTAALDDQARKTTEQIAAHADEASRAASLPSTVDPKKGAALVALPKAPPVPAGGAGRLADAAGYLELIQTAGDIPGMPSARDIPVIGPVLAMYLRFRGATAAWKRLGGRIPAGPNAKIAARSAEIRDKAASIVDGILEGTGKAAKRARTPAVVGGGKLLDTLRHSLYPDGEERGAAKTAAEATKARVVELAAVAANPDAARAAIRRQVGATDPDIAAAIEAATMRKLTYLQRHAPKQPPPGPLGSKPWTPSASEVERFARRVRAAEDPMSTLQDVERGTITPEAAETLREVYPALFGEVRMRLFSRAAELEAKLPYRQVVNLSLLFDVPLDDSLRPENLLAIQSAHATSAQAATGPSGAAPQPGQPPAPSVAGPVRLSNLYETAEIRRASRR